jgi:hypothetical protein
VETLLRPVPAGARMVYPRIGGSGAPRALPLAPQAFLVKLCTALVPCASSLIAGAN